MPDFIVNPMIDTFLRSQTAKEALQNLELFNTLTFESVSIVSQILTDVYSNIGNLVTNVNNSAGKYVYSIAAQFDYTQANKNAFFRFRVDGGAYQEIVLPIMSSYTRLAFTDSFTAGSHTIEFEGRKEDSAGVLTIIKADTSFVRIGN